MKTLALASSLVTVASMTILAQATGGDVMNWNDLAKEILRTMSGAGVAGAVLAWILWRLEPRLRGHEQSIDRQTRFLAVFLTEMPHVMENTKRYCQDVIGEIDKIEGQRQK